MTVQTETSRVDYVANGSTTTFAIPFPFLEQKDFITVMVNGVLQTLNIHYLIVGQSVSFFVAPATGSAINIIRDPPITQLTDYSDNDPFPASATEDALDKLTMIDQALFHLLAGKLDGSTSGVSTDNAVVRWNGTGGNSIQDSPGITIDDQMRMRIEGWTPVYDLAGGLMAAQILQHPIGFTVPDGRLAFLNRVSMPGGGYIPVTLGGIAGFTPAVAAGHAVYMEAQPSSDPTSALYSYISALSNRGPGATKTIYGRATAQAGSTGVVMGLVGAIDTVAGTHPDSAALELDCSPQVGFPDVGNLMLMQNTGGSRIRYGLFSFAPINIKQAYLSLWMGPTSDADARAVEIKTGPTGSLAGGLSLNGGYFGPGCSLLGSTSGLFTIVRAAPDAASYFFTLPSTAGTAGQVLTSAAGGTMTWTTVGSGGGGLDAEQVDDRVAALLVAGTNVTLSYNDAANTLTINALVTGGGGGDVTAAAAFGTDNRVIRSDGTAKGVQASLVTIDDNGVLTLTGAAGPSPQPMLVFSNYEDNAVPPVSVSHIKLHSNTGGDEGFGIGGGQLNYIAGVNHSFYHSGDLTHAAVVINTYNTPTISFAGDDGTLVVHGGLGATGQIVTGGRFVNAPSNTQGAIGCYFQSTLTQANLTDTQDTGLAAFMDINLVSATDALIVRGIQQIVNNDMTGGGKVLNLRLQEMTFNANAGSKTGTYSANYIQMGGTGAVDTGIGLDIAALLGTTKRGIWDRVVDSVWKHDGITASNSHDTGALVVAGGVGIGGNLTLNATVATPTGSAAVPSYTFRTGPGNGMYLSAPNTLSFATGGIERMRIGPAGGMLFASPTFNIIAPTGNIHILEIGSLTEVGLAIVDFHSSLPATDFDVRIQCSGGSTTAGLGEFLIWCGTLRIPVSNPTPAAPPDGSIWIDGNAINSLKIRLGGVTRTVTLT